MVCALSRPARLTSPVVIRALRVEENERLKRIVADLTLDRQILQEIVSKKL